jgi:hypothetical protein
MEIKSKDGLRASRVAVLIAVLGGLLAFGIRWYYVMHAQVFQPLDEPNVRADAADYYRYAWNIVHTGTFSDALPGSAVVTPNSFRDPGYPLFLSIWMRLSSDYDAWYGSVLIAQCLLGALTVSLSAFAMRRLLSSGLLAAGMLLMAFWPHNVAMASFVLSENLVACLCAAAICFLGMAAETRSVAWLVAGGVTASCAALTNAVLLPLGLLASLVFYARQRLTLKQAAILAFASLLLPACWGIRAASLPDGQTSTQRATMNFVQGSWPTYHAAYQLAMKNDDDGWRTMAAIDAETRRFQGDMLSGLRGVAERMSAAPLSYLAWYADKPALLWGWDIRMGQGDVYVYPTQNSPFKELAAWRAVESFCRALNPLLMTFALAGTLLGLFRAKAAAPEVALALAVTFITFAYTVLQSEPRYSVAFRPMEIGLACCAIQALATRWHRYRQEQRAT